MSDTDAWLLIGLFVVFGLAGAWLVVVFLNRLIDRHWYGDDGW